ncbi:MAG: DNA polymerase III subunit gamma/tau [Holosporaceae bacterium]|jgi:DNA polymerase-3 subunit gamma/tau|nr:DNA polymerase III subunit gamma/tau [Holosporaceae bacterium]
MSTYIPLATKYRPQRFSDVVGQDMTIKIITRGIQKNRLGSALLFSGTRGIGKTTIARILAKAFRCENHSPNDPEPCCKCESCLNFALDNQIDVIEIDAASNTGVDDVREIIESSRYRPTTGEFKIFIIDEVHMLSKSAFNALLKTLEEPPAHVKFLFATTETYKIPETITSRVLKFDLKRVDADLIAQHLSSVCNQENVIADAEVLSLIARAADGSIRDSFSILDQAINISENNKLSYGDIRDMLNLSDEDDVMDLLKLIFSADIKSTVRKYREMVKGNASSMKIINSLIDCIHLLTCIKANIPPLELIVSESSFAKLNKLSEKVSLASTSRIWQMLLKGVEELKFCDRPEIVLEMILIRIAYVSELPDLQELIDGITKNTPKPLLKNENTSYINSNGESESLVDEALKMFSNAKVEQM